jgi:hypothetical protein
VPVLRVAWCPASRDRHDPIAPLDTAGGTIGIAPPQPTGALCVRYRGGLTGHAMPVLGRIRPSRPGSSTPAALAGHDLQTGPLPATLDRTEGQHR